MQTIYKYPIMPTFYQKIKIPHGYKILDIQVQGKTPCIWAAVDITNLPIDVEIETIGTGHELEFAGSKQYVGTYQLSQGEGNPIFVGHVFILSEASCN